MSHLERMHEPGGNTCKRAADKPCHTAGTFVNSSAPNAIDSARNAISAPRCVIRIVFCSTLSSCDSFEPDFDTGKGVSFSDWMPSVCVLNTGVVAVS